MNMTFADPANHEQAARLAHAMYEHIMKAGLGGLPFADAAAALAMVNGMLLSGAYRRGPQRDTAARVLAKAALLHAERMEHLPRVPFGAPAAGEA